MNTDSYWLAFKRNVLLPVNYICISSLQYCRGRRWLVMFKMLSASFLHLSLVVIMVHGEPYNCRSRYIPQDHIRKLRVPPNCKVTTPSYCPRTWKSGIPEGRATSKPLIYSEFISCHEGNSSCGFVPINPTSGEVLGNSGVTIGTGIDLGSKSSSSPALRSLSNFIVAKLEPYFGLRQNFAACAAIEQPLSLSSSEAVALTDAVIKRVGEEIKQIYNNEKAERALVFTSLARGVRTAIASVWFQFGYPKAYPKFWKFVTENNWEEAVKELRNFYSNPNDQLEGNLKRRNNEADIIEATLVECNRSIDCVILLDESGSVSDSAFQESLTFVINLIKAFPDEKLRGKDATRFGLSTFETNYNPRFYLSSYTSQSQYQTAISRIDQTNGGTRLGQALNLLLVDQFTPKNGLRGEEHGFPRVLIVLTDGISHDSVAFSAQRVRDRNIVIYAIGIGRYNRNQLEQVASSPSHVFTLSTFAGLETFVATLTAATCNEPQPVSLNKTVQTITRKSQYLYFVYQVHVNFNLEINVVDLAGETFVYVSRSNPHPYKYDNDLSFDRSSLKHKVLVISPRTLNNPTKRSTRALPEDVTSIYVSVTANTDSVLFAIKGNECNPLNCHEGTNEVNSAPTFKKSYSSFALTMVSLRCKCND